MRRTSFCTRLVCILFVIATGIAHSQKKTLVVQGHSGQAPVIDSDGKSYVDIQALASLTNGSLSFNGNQITLSLQGAPANQSASQPASQPESQGFSKGFLSAGIEAMSEIREWRMALQSAVRYGFPPNSDWVNRYHNAATSSVRQASVAASTDSDRSAAQLISMELNHMQQLSDKYISARNSMTYIAPDAVEKDPLDQKIVNCAHSLSAMAAGGQFHDDGSCH